jgi:hypothetical protein
MSDVIFDGYTEKAYIKAIPRIHGEVRFEFRPMLVEERSQLFEGSGKMSADLYERKSAKTVSQKIVSWSVTQGVIDGEEIPYPVSPVNFLRLKPALYQRMTSIIVGLDAGDADPLLSDGEKAEQIDEQYESALQEQPIGIIREVRNEKNL